jgi:hypothetical protein
LLPAVGRLRRGPDGFPLPMRSAKRWLELAAVSKERVVVSADDIGIFGRAVDVNAVGRPRR